MCAFYKWSRYFQCIQSSVNAVRRWVVLKLIMNCSCLTLIVACLTILDEVVFIRLAFILLFTTSPCCLNPRTHWDVDIISRAAAEKHVPVEECPAQLYDSTVRLATSTMPTEAWLPRDFDAVHHHQQQLAAGLRIVTTSNECVCCRD